MQHEQENIFDTPLCLCGINIKSAAGLHLCAFVIGAYDFRVLLIRILSPQWHAFSMPELKNFLRILQREEEEHVKQIMQRYALARTKMQEALTGSTPG